MSDIEKYLIDDFAAECKTPNKGANKGCWMSGSDKKLRKIPHKNIEIPDIKKYKDTDR